MLDRSDVASPAEAVATGTWVPRLAEFKASVSVDVKSGAVVTGLVEAVPTVGVKGVTETGVCVVTRFVEAVPTVGVKGATETGDAGVTGVPADPVSTGDCDAGDSGVTSVIPPCCVGAAPWFGPPGREFPAIGPAITVSKGGEGAGSGRGGGDNPGGGGGGSRGCTGGGNSCGDGATLGGDISGNGGHGGGETGGGYRITAGRNDSGEGVLGGRGTKEGNGGGGDTGVGDGRGAGETINGTGAGGGCGAIGGGVGGTPKGPCGGRAIATGTARGGATIGDVTGDGKMAVGGSAKPLYGGRRVRGIRGGRSTAGAATGGGVKGSVGTPSPVTGKAPGIPMGAATGIIAGDGGLMTPGDGEPCVLPTDPALFSAPAMTAPTSMDRGPKLDGGTPDAAAGLSVEA